MKKLITTILLTLVLTSVSFAGFGSSSGGFASSYSNQMIGEIFSETNPVESGTSLLDILGITYIVLLVVVVVYGIYVAVFKKF